jgi:CRP-like cAMP-binding protein
VHSCAGDFFGEVSLLTGMAARSTLTAITPGVLLGFSSEDLKPILASRPELVESVSNAVARKQHLFTMLDRAAIQEMPIEQMISCRALGAFSTCMCR